jgi:hypothetical protein
MIRIARGSGGLALTSALPLAIGLRGCVSRKDLFMSIEPGGDDTEAERKSGAMKAQLRKDVDSWTKARSEASPERIAGPSAPVDRPASSHPASSRPISSRPVPRAKKPRTTPPAAVPADIRPKPFNMSYGGKTTKAYIRYMIDRGSR